MCMNIHLNIIVENHYEDPLFIDSCFRCHSTVYSMQVFQEGFLDRSYIWEMYFVFKTSGRRQLFCHGYSKLKKDGLLLL